MALLIRDESIPTPADTAFYTTSYEWMNLLKSKLLPDHSLFYLDSVSGDEVKVRFSINELDDASSILNQESVLFVVYAKNRQSFEKKSIDGLDFPIVRIHAVSKFVIRNIVPGTFDREEREFTVEDKVVMNSFKAEFNKLKYDSVNYIIAHARACAAYGKETSRFYAPISCLCQCSGSGKSKSCTTATKKTPGFYVCFREDKKTSFAYPEANSISAAFMSIFEKTDYIADSLQDQRKLPCNQSTVGRCLLFIARCIKSYNVAIALQFASALNSNSAGLDDEYLLLKCLSDFSSKYFEGNIQEPDFFKRFDCESLMLDIFKHSKGTSGYMVSVQDVIHYIMDILEHPWHCFDYDESIFTKEFQQDSDFNVEYVRRACTSIRLATNQNPFIFFIDEAGILAKMGGYKIYKMDKSSAGKYSAFQILRRALSYLSTSTNIHFVALGTKSSMEELSPPIIDNSLRGLPRKSFFPPIILTQNFDIWRDKYPLNELHPCYHQLTNGIFFKFLVTLGHPLFSSVSFQNVIELASVKLLNGSVGSTNLYLLAIWMIRAGLNCDPKSVFAGSLVENHMATLFNVRSSPSDSQTQGQGNVPTFAQEGKATYDITYQSIPCLALAARKLSNELKDISEFFRMLASKLDYFVADRGRLGESIGCFGTLLVIDKVSQNLASTAIQPIASSTASVFARNLAQEMESITTVKFHPLWKTKECLLESEDNESPQWDTFNHFKSITVGAFLLKLLGKDDFAAIEPLLSPVALGALMNATHFVSLSRFSDSRRFGKEPALANDLVFDSLRNIVTHDRLRVALARQCAIILPPNSYAFDAIIPVCLPRELVTDVDGKVSVVDVVPGVPNGVPDEVFLEDPEAHAGKSRYRPIYSFVGIQFKTGGFEAGALPIMQARLHFVPCPEHGSTLVADCRHCENEAALEQIFNHQISLLYCFKAREDVQMSQVDSLTVNYGAKLGHERAQQGCSAKELFQQLYPDSSPDFLEQAVEETNFATQRKPLRTFEDFFLKHKIGVSDDVDLVNFAWEDNVGCTYRSTEVKKYELALKRYHDDKKRSSVAQSAVRKSKASNARTTMKLTQPRIPSPVRLKPKYASCRMSTIVIYGWNKWKPFIGADGVDACEKMFDDFNYNPIRNVEEVELECLAPSLKVIMSSKLVGYDQYEAHNNDDDDSSSCDDNVWDEMVSKRLKR